MTGPFLIETPRRVHRYWWTCVPALPTTRDCQTYRTLRRIWHDHTMNSFRQQADGSWRANARGFYIEGIEDHMTPAIFETFSILPSGSWLPILLDRMEISHAGAIRQARWSYFFEEIYEGRRFCIADIVLAWQDDDGEAVLVFEAKNRGIAPGPKDHPSTASYLKMPSVRAIRRRHYRLLVDEADRSAVERYMPDLPPAVTWQALRTAQRTAGEMLPLSTRQNERVLSAIDWNFARHGIAYEEQVLGAEWADCQGTADEYAALSSERLPAGVEAFLIGSTCCAAAARGVMPAPPYAYLGQEPSALEVYVNGIDHQRGYQTVADRRVLHWRLPTQRE